MKQTYIHTYRHTRATSRDASASKNEIIMVKKGLQVTRVTNGIIRVKMGSKGSKRVKSVILGLKIKKG